MFEERDAYDANQWQTMGNKQNMILRDNRFATRKQVLKIITRPYLGLYTQTQHEQL